MFMRVVRRMHAVLPERLVDQRDGENVVAGSDSGRVACAQTLGVALMSGVSLTGGITSSEVGLALRKAE